mmetsp:Transcript_11501/g.28967  ORF Transcript_11501/g.28967 Transcript_11501/m.28967 type:complete len:308 (+) Transcript_11501:179-1102(+)
MNPIGIEKEPTTTQNSHWCSDRGTVSVNLPPNEMMRYWVTTVKMRTPMNIAFRPRPEKALSSSFSLRLLNSLKTWQNTKALKTMVERKVSKSAPRNDKSAYNVNNSTSNWKVAWPIIMRHIRRVMRGADRPYGGRLRSSGVGCSVARAKAAIVSMIRFTHRSCTAFNGLLPLEIAPMNAIATAATLTVSWNCTNLRMESNTLRPHMTAFTMDEKLSSSKMMSDAFLATSVPMMPMAKPTSASRSCGASLVPSPVTATTSPCPLRSSTRRSLSSGEQRAITSSWGRTFFTCASVILRNCGPSSTTPSS